MGYTFVPTLIQTVDWEAVSWESLRYMLSDEFERLAKKNDVDGILSKIEQYFDDLSKVESAVRSAISDFINDYLNACGVISASNELYQDVVLAIIETFRRF